MFGLPTPAQESAAWLRRLTGEPDVAIRALAELPPALDAEFAAPIARLLRNPDANLRNHAAAWLRNRPALTDSVWPVLAELRSGDDVEASRAAGAVCQALARHRTFGIDDLREQLRDASRVRHALQHIEQLPDGGLSLLADILAVNPLQHADAVLQKLIRNEPARVEQELVAALSRPGDHIAMVGYLERVAPDLTPHLQVIDSLLADPQGHDHRAVAIVTRAVLQGVPPPANWLELLRRDDGRNGRQGLLNELRQHAVPACVWPHLAPLLRNIECHITVAALLLELGSAAADHAEQLCRAIDLCQPTMASCLADAAAQLAPATRSCAPALLRCLRRDQDPYTWQRALLALGELGNDDPAVLTAVAACLGSDNEVIRLDALVALGRLGAVTHREAIVAAGQRGPAPVTAVASLVLGSFAVTSRPTESLLADLNSLDRERAMLALRPLRSREVAPQQLFEAARETKRRNGRDWREQTMIRQIVSALVRQATSDQTADAASRERGLSMLGWIQTQDAVRLLDWIGAGVDGPRLLGGILFDQGDPRHALAALAAIGGRAAHLEPTVAAFVHHPEFAVRTAAIECLRAIAGPDAAEAAKQRPDLWSRWWQLQKAQTNDPGVAIALDASMPIELRVRALRQLARSRAREWPTVAFQLSSLLLHEDRSLRLAALELIVRRQDLVISPEGHVPRTISANVLGAFAGGSRDVRTSLAALVRSHLQVAWPTRLVQQVLEQDSSASGSATEALRFVETAPLTQRALTELDRPGHELPTAWLQGLLASHPRLALMVLQRRREPPTTPFTPGQGKAPPAELLPALADLLAPRAVTPPHVVEVLMRVEAGRQLLLQRTGDLPAEQRLAILATARGDLRPYLGDLEEQVRQAVARGSMPHASTMEILTKLPWTDPAADLAALQLLVEQLWQAQPNRPPLQPLLQAMGPAAHFATGDLVGMLQTKDSGRGEMQRAENAATTLLAIGIPDPVDAWLRALPPNGDLNRFSSGSDLLEKAWATLLTQRVLEATDAELAAACTPWLRHARRLRPEQRGAVAVRLLAHAEAAGTPAVSVTQGWLDGELGVEAYTQLAAFFARRKALGIRPDPLSEAVASRLLASYPDLAVEALRDGLARVPQTLGACDLHQQSPFNKQRIAAVAAKLIELAVACPDRADAAMSMSGSGNPDVHLGIYAGRILARAGAAPLDTILPLLDEAGTRSFALALLSELGALAAAAVDAVEPLAASDDERFQRHAAQTLARLGPRGVLRLGGLVATRPQLLCFLLGALHSNDEDCAAAVSVLLQLHLVPDLNTAELLRQRLQRCTDKKANSLVMLLLLTTGQRASDEDWLKVIDFEPAVIRQRAVQALGKSAAGPLQLGAIVELLDDHDASVRAVALDALLATPEHVAMCRRPLEEFAATAEAAVAARVRAALSTPR